MIRSAYDSAVAEALAAPRLNDASGRPRRSPFPSPPDWRDVVIYQLVTDRFNRPGQPDEGLWSKLGYGFRGGTFNGVREKLDYLADLGVDAIWLSPVQKNCPYDNTYHGYAIQDFFAVEPRFGSGPGLAEAELRQLVDAAHDRGLRVIFDVVLNHAGDVFDYDVPGDKPPGFRDEPYPIRWRDAQGSPRQDWPDAASVPTPGPDDLVWPRELHDNSRWRRRGSDKQRQGDFYSLKELCDEDKRLWDVLIRACCYLVAEYDCDGLRIDTLMYVTPEFAQTFGNAMREYALSLGKTNFFTFGEVWESEEVIARFVGRSTRGDATGDAVGVDAALDFPLRGVLTGAIKGLSDQSGPVSAARLAAMYEHRKEVQRGVVSSHGDASRYFVTFLDNHDLRWRYYYTDPVQPHRYDDQVAIGLGALLCLQGVPCIYYGTEQGLSGGCSDHDEAMRRPLWAAPPESRFNPNHPFYRWLKQLLAVRRTRPELRYGRQYFRPVSGDGHAFGIGAMALSILAWSRILCEQETVVVANPNLDQPWAGYVLVDSGLNACADITYQVLWSNKQANAASATVMDAARSGVRMLPVTLAPGELQILGR